MRNVCHITLMLCIASNIYTAEKLPQFFKLAKAQPKELAGFQDMQGKLTYSPIKILDLHYNPTNENAIIACSEINDKGESSICLYDPEQSEVIQTIIFDNAKNILGGAFSENAQFFTVGNAQTLCEPQNFYIYKNCAEKRTECLDKIIPKVLLALIREYENERSYLLAKTVQSIPSLWSCIFLPDIIINRFSYNSQQDTITCYGAPVQDQYNGGLLGNKTKITPIGVILISKPNNITIIDPKKTCSTRRYHLTNSRDYCISSINNQHIVYTNAADNKNYLLDRTANTEILVPKLPKVLDNTGTMHLKKYRFPSKDRTYDEDERQNDLAIALVNDQQQNIIHSCRYPTSQSYLFGSASAICMDKNYCLTRDIRTIAMIHGRTAAVGIAIPSKTSSTEEVGSLYQEAQNWGQCIVNKNTPSLRELQQKSSITRVSSNFSWYARIMPYVPSFISSLGLAGLSMCLSRTSWFSPKLTESLSYAVGVGSLYYAYNLYKRFTKTR